jgi:phasin
MATTTAKTSRTTRAGNGPFDAFTFPAPAFEIPAAFREFAESSATQAREAYDRVKSAAEEATGLVEGTLETAREGAFAIGVKAIDAAKSNSDASFAFARDFFGARTASELIELQSTFARKQFEAFTSQFKEFQALTEKLVTDTTRPVAEKVEKTFKDLKVA